MGLIDSLIEELRSRPPGGRFENSQRVWNGTAPTFPRSTSGTSAQRQEPYRLKCSYIKQPLQGTHDRIAGARRTSLARLYAVLRRDAVELELMRISLTTHDGRRIADGRCFANRTALSTIGLHLATLTYASHSDRSPSGHSAAL